MRRRAILIGLLAQMALMSPSARAGGITAVASFSVLADMMRRIAGKWSPGRWSNVTSLVPATPMCMSGSRRRVIPGR